MNQTIGNSKQEPPETRSFKRRIGTTYFNVAVHFNPNSHETAEDKIARLIRSEATVGKAVDII